jgi:hypothetical protein
LLQTSIQLSYACLHPTGVTAAEGERFFNAYAACVHAQVVVCDF